MDTLSIMSNKFGKSLPFCAKIIFTLCFLGAIDFLNGSYYWFFLSIVVLLLFDRVTIPTNLSSALLLLFAVEIIAFENRSGFSFTSIIKPFFFLVCYVLGYNFFGLLSNNKGHENAVFLRWIVLVLSVGCFGHYLLNWATNLNSTSRNTVDFWTGKMITATGQMALACLPLAVAITFMLSNNKLRYKITACVILLGVFGYNMILAGRTLFGITGIVFLAAYVLNGLTNHSRHKVQLLFWPLIVLLALILLYYIDFLSIRSLIEESNLYKRFVGRDVIAGVLSDGRLVYKEQYLMLMLKYPFGGNKIHTIVGGYAHDLYLDTYDEIGILGLITIVAFVSISIRNMIKFILDKTIAFDLKQLVFCTYIVSNLEFWIEPILKGMPWLLAMYCMIDGAVARCLLTNGGQNVENSGN